MFTLCGHVLAPGGDQPAMAKWMMMKGHNAVLPCQYCNIKGICTPNSTNPALYVPLNRSMLPDHGMPHCYDPLALPMHTQTLSACGQGHIVVLLVATSRF